MTREEIIALAKQHGASAYTNRHYQNETYMTFSPEKLEAFFHAAQALEREGVEMAIKSHYVAAEEPELPERYDFVRDTERGVTEDVYTAAQMHDHYAAGVRAGMGQSQALQRGLGKVLADPEKHGLDLGDKQ